ncbi:MAG TPA: 3-hydroxyacyl-CoA dehydrogenase family protein [Bacteroidota bacterium]|nr:3-hydroxyacyl-CoA dehydrogenase family protein [Bacteroidota bacterium]
MPTSSQNIFLIGDYKLIEEFGSVCNARGLNVLCKLNPPSTKKVLPKFLKRCASIPRNVAIAFELTNGNTAIKQRNLKALDKALNSKKMILSSSVTITAMEQSTWIKHPSRLVGMSAFPTLLSKKLIEISATTHTGSETISHVQDFFLKLGNQISVVQDRIGMVMPRILCMLINEACFAITENIASPRDIDTAMKSGTNYPLGPIEWGNTIGFKNVLDVLEALWKDLGEERYRTAPLLKQMAIGIK